MGGDDLLRDPDHDGEAGFRKVVSRRGAESQRFEGRLGAGMMPALLPSDVVHDRQIPALFFGFIEGQVGTVEKQLGGVDPWKETRNAYAARDPDSVALIGAAVL